MEQSQYRPTDAEAKEVGANCKKCPSRRPVPINISRLTPKRQCIASGPDSKRSYDQSRHAERYDVSAFATRSLKEVMDC